MSNIDVSVVIPSYNSANFIRKCIASVASQEGVSLEIHVVDDAGTDETREIIESMKAELDEGVLISHYRNNKAGQSTARNIGIDACRGEFVAFLDSDDYFLGTQDLKRWVQHARNNTAELVCAHFTVKNVKTGKVQDGRATPLPVGGGVCNVDSHPELANVSSCWQLLYLRDFLNSHQLRFSTKLRQREDRPFFLRALLAADRVFVTPDLYIEHTDHPESSFKIKDVDQFEQYLIHLDDLAGSIGDIGGAQASPGRKMFARSSFALCLINLVTYWKPLVLELYRSESSYEQSLVDSFFKLHARIDSGSLLAGNHALKLPVERLVILDEFTLDLIRVLLRGGRFDSIIRLLENETLLTADLLENGLIQNDDDEYILARYLSFSRGLGKSVLSKSIFSLSRSAVTNMRLILHVGMPKTGSSSLQNFLELNRLRLVKQGVYYPTMGVARETGSRRHRTAGHASVIRAALNGNDDLMSLILKEIAVLPCEISTVVISSENILSDTFWNGLENIAKIRDMLPFSQISVYGSHRDLMTWIESAYLEKISNPRNKFTKTPEDFIKQWGALGLLDNAHIKTVLDDAFGGENVTFRAYEDVKENGGTITDFCELYGISTDDAFELHAEATNASCTPGQALAVYGLKKLGFSADSIEKNLAEIFAKASSVKDVGQLFDRKELASMIDAVKKLVSFREAEAIPPGLITRMGGQVLDQYPAFIDKDTLVSVVRNENKGTKIKYEDEVYSPAITAVENNRKDKIIYELNNRMHSKNAEIARMNKEIARMNKRPRLFRLLGISRR